MMATLIPTAAMAAPGDIRQNMTARTTMLGLVTDVPENLTPAPAK